MPIPGREGGLGGVDSGEEKINRKRRNIAVILIPNIIA